MALARHPPPAVQGGERDAQDAGDHAGASPCSTNCDRTASPPFQLGCCSFGSHISILRTHVAHSVFRKVGRSNFIGAGAKKNIVKGNKITTHLNVVTGIGGIGGVNDPLKQNKTFDPNSISGTGYGIYTDGSQDGSPLLTSAVVSGSSITIQGTLDSTPDSSFILEFFGNQDAVTPGYEQGEVFLGTITVTTGDDGNVDFSAAFDNVYGNYVSATATGTACDGYTSQFSTYVAIEDESSVSLSSSLNPSYHGQSVTFTADVSSSGNPTPTGTVTFYDGPTALDTETLDSYGGASFTTSTLPVGDNAIIAVYSGDSNFNAGTSDTLTQEVDAATTGIYLYSSLNPSENGQAVTFTAYVQPPYDGTPTGTVTFYDGTTPLDTETLDTYGGASYTTSALAVGNHSITAVYSGDDIFTGSTSDVFTQQVNAATTSVYLYSSLNPSENGQSVTFAAYVQPSYDGSPTGTVTFYDGTTALDTETLDTYGGASYTTADLPVGSHSITAVYSGDAIFTGSTSAMLTQEVDAATTSVYLYSSLNPSENGQSVTFTAYVSASYEGTPTGTVSFYDGTTLLDTETLDSYGGASYTTSALPVGSHSITAVYSGESIWTGSTSAVRTQQVNLALTTVYLSSSLNPAGFGQDVTFTAYVQPSYDGTPTGTVSFYDGTTLLATETLDSYGGASFTTSALAVGNHSITAVYSGDSIWTSSTSDALTQQVTSYRKIERPVFQRIRGGTVS